MNEVHQSGRLSKVEFLAASEACICILIYSRLQRESMKALGSLNRGPYFLRPQNPTTEELLNIRSDTNTIVKEISTAKCTEINITKRSKQCLKSAQAQIHWDSAVVRKKVF